MFLLIFLSLSLSDRSQEAVDKSAESGARCAATLSYLLEALQDLRLLSPSSDAEEAHASTVSGAVAISSNREHDSRQRAARIA